MANQDTWVNRYQNVKAFWILLHQYTMEVAMAPTGTRRRAKLQSDHHHKHTKYQRSVLYRPAGVVQAIGQGGRMPLQISIQGGKNRSLPSNFSMTSLPVVRLRNDLYCVEWDVKLYYTTPCGPTEIQ